MDNITLTLPSGYIVTLHKSLTYRAARAIQNALMGDMVIPVNPGEDTDLAKKTLEVRFANIQGYQDEAMRRLLVSVQDKDGNELPDPLEAVMDMDEADAEIVENKVSELTGKAKKQKQS